MKLLTLQQLGRNMQLPFQQARPGSSTSDADGISLVWMPSPVFFYASKVPFPTCNHWYFCHDFWWVLFWPWCVFGGEALYLVTFLVALTKYLTRSNLREEVFILAYHWRDGSLMVRQA